MLKIVLQPKEGEVQRKDGMSKRVKEEPPGFKTGLWDIANKRMSEDRGALPKKYGNIMREYKAIHEEHFLSSGHKEAKEEECKSGSLMADAVSMLNSQFTFCVSQTFFLL